MLNVKSISANTDIAHDPIMTYPAAMADGYLEPVVGESFYPDAVRRCRAGMRAEIMHTPDNPHDGEALAVMVRGQQIGHIGRESWVRRAWHEQGLRFSAVIHSTPARYDNPGIVLRVIKMPATAMLPRRGWLARLFG